MSRGRQQRGALHLPLRTTSLLRAVPEPVPTGSISDQEPKNVLIIEFSTQWKRCPYLLPSSAVAQIPNYRAMLERARCECAPAVAGAARRAPSPDAPASDLPRGPRAVASRRQPRVSPVTCQVHIKLVPSQRSAQAYSSATMWRGCR